MSKGKFVIIDGNSLVYRAFYALPSLSTSHGESTNAVYGFTTMLMKLLDEEAPQYVAVTFDTGTPTFRHELFDEYKANRSKMPDELGAQLPIIRDLIDSFNFARFEMDGFEADDVIGTLAIRAMKEDRDVLIVSSDRDLLQLIRPGIRVMLVKKGITDTVTFDEEKVREEYGAPPALLVDIKGLMGDKSDNIPGIPGIGVKTALMLMEDFQDLEELLTKTHQVKSARCRRLLEEYSDQAILSKKLATIVQDVPIDFNVEDCKVKEPDAAKVLELFERLELRNFTERFIERFAHGEEISSDTFTSEIKGENIIVRSQEELEAVIEKVQSCKELSLEVATDHYDPMKANVLGIAFAINTEIGYYVPLHQGAGVDRDLAMNMMSDLFKNPDVKKICHDGKYKFVLASRAGLELNGLASDIMIASYLVDTASSDHELEKLVTRYLGRQLRKEQGYRSLSGGSIEPQPLSEEICQDVRDILSINHMLQKRIEGESLLKLFADIEMPLVEVLADMELAGIAVDEQGLSLISKEWEDKLAELNNTIQYFAREEVNPNSPKQLGKILFEKLGLPVIKRTKTGYSTDADVLERLRKHHPIADAIIEYRQLLKLKSTYADAFPELINSKTGRLHTTFNQAVTATGRLSSAEPNLQNIPVRTEEGKRIRRVFVPGKKGHLFLSADYSQIELRVLAHISGDENLVDSFIKDQDVHTRTASEVFGIPLEEVTGEQRNKAKAVNFGIIYGISPFGLAKGINVSRKEAEEYIDSYFNKYKGVKEYIEKIVKQAYEEGYVTTLLNRKRYLPELKNRNAGIRNFGERTAMNTPIQGTAADIIKMAMIKVARELKERGFFSQLLLQVHDELLLEVPIEELLEAGEMVKEIMENVFTMSVPLKVELNAGQNWADMDSDIVGLLSKVSAY